MNSVTHFQQDWKYAVRKLQQIAHVKGVRQKELAVATGSSEAKFSQFFKCKNRPNLEFYFAVCGALGVRVAYFTDADEASNTEPEKCTPCPTHAMLNARDELLEILSQRGYKLVDVLCASIEVWSLDKCIYTHLLKTDRTEVDDAAFLKLLDFKYNDRTTGLSLQGFVWMRDGSWFDRACMGRASFWTHRKRPIIPAICKL